MVNPEILLTVSLADQGQRLDRWLTAALSSGANAGDDAPSRSAIQRWLEEGRVLVDGAPAKASLKIESGQVVVTHPPTAPQETDLQAEDLPLTIVYEDDDLLVVNKPSGMVVHPAPGHEGGTLVNAVLHHCPQIEGVGGERRPGLVHRLDKETSGLIVVAKNDRAHHYLQAQFKARTVFKEYLALLDGRIDPPQGRINAPIGRHPNDRLRQAILPPNAITGEARGRDAITDYRLLAHYTVPVRDATGLSSFSLVAAIIHTGRTHQIRVHFAWRQHPVVGDLLYGFKRARLPIARQFLHAHRLRFRLPSNGVEQEFSAPLPLDLQKVLDALDALTR